MSGHFPHRSPRQGGAARAAALLVCLLALVLSGRRAALGAEPAPRLDKGLEYKVKAAYIYNFIKFIDWSGAAPMNPAGPIRICVLGKDPFGPALAPFSRREARGRRLAVERIPSANLSGGCHVVFVCDSERGRLEEVLKEAGRGSALTVGESEGFAARGGIIGFVIRGGKVRLEINRRAAEAAGLKISAKLLELATIVD